MGALCCRHTGAPDHEMLGAHVPQVHVNQQYGMLQLSGSPAASVVQKTYPTFLQGAMMLLAVVYLLLLPLLRLSGFAHTCVTVETDSFSYQYPYCAYDFGVLGFDVLVCSGASVSDFIATPQATGLLAATFFWSSLHLWMPQDFVVGWPAYLTLLVFQLNFGAFLSIPVTRWPSAHLFVVGIFCSAGLAHMLIMLKLSQKWTTCICAVGAIIGYFGVICTGFAALIFTPGFCQMFPFAFYTFETLGLGGMTLFIFFWRNPSYAIC